MKKDYQSSRRNFLKKGLAGAAGLSVFPSLSKLEAQGKEKNKDKIIYRTLGRTGYRLPIISMGSSSNEYLIRAALNKGIVHFDTAHNYGNGVDEITFGRILKGKSRDSFVIATKIIGMRAPGTGLPSRNIKPAEFKADFHRQMEISLKRLQMDYVDILYLHSADNPRLLRMNMIRDIMQELKDEGKARFLGVATHRIYNIYPIVEEKIYDVILTPYNFRDPYREVTEKALAYAVNAGCGIIGMKLMAGAYWDRERKNPINGRAAIKWALQNENVHTVIPGINTFSQLEEDFSIMADMKITPEEKEGLRLGTKLNMPGLYCGQCDQCSSQCRYNLDVPRIMRSYMYAYGYKNPAKAANALQYVDLSNPACTQCSSCSIRCPMNFDIKNRILDIARIKQVPSEFLV